MRIVGLDGGARRVGVAVSDDLGLTAQPCTTIRREPGDDASFVEALKVTLGEPPPDLVVVGLPLRLDGTEGGAARQARRLALLLEEELGLATELWDERLTSRQAEGIVHQAFKGAAPADSRAAQSPRDSQGRQRPRAPRASRGRLGTKARKAIRRDGAVDRVAAAIILQSYLDAHQRREEP